MDTGDGNSGQPPESSIINLQLTIVNHIDGKVRISKTDDEGKALTGAKFQLCKYGTSWEEVSEHSEIDLTEVSEMEISNLLPGRYRLEETDAPAGYLILDKYIYFSVNESGIITLTDEAGTGANPNENADLTDGSNNIRIKNIPGPELPHTGGIGTTVFYILGTLLLGGSAIMLIARRRLRRN